MNFFVFIYEKLGISIRFVWVRLRIGGFFIKIWNGFWIGLNFGMGQRLIYLKRIFLCFACTLVSHARLREPKNSWKFI